MTGWVCSFDDIINAYEIFVANYLKSGNFISCPRERQEGMWKETIVSCNNVLSQQWPRGKTHKRHVRILGLKAENQTESPREKSKSSAHRTAVIVNMVIIIVEIMLKWCIIPCDKVKYNVGNDGDDYNEDDGDKDDTGIDYNEDDGDKEGTDIYYNEDDGDKEDTDIDYTNDDEHV
jgi:hypothetical protein